MLVVFHHERGSGELPLRFVGGRLGSRHRCPAQRKPDREATSFPDDASHLDRAPVQLGQGTDQCQTEPGSPVKARMPAVGLHERLEQPLHLRLLDSDARVFDGDLHLSFRRQRLRPHLYVTAVRGELDGVGEEIDDDLFETALIGLNTLHRRARFELDGDVLAHGRLADHAHRALHGAAEVDVAEMKLQLARLDLGEVEDVIDQLQQVAPALFDGTHGLVLFFVQRTIDSRLQYLGDAEDGVQRGA